MSADKRTSEDEGRQWMARGIAPDEQRGERLR